MDAVASGFGAALGCAAAAALLTWGAGRAGIRLFPDFRSREQKAGEYRRDVVSAARATSSRLPAVGGPAMLLGLTVAASLALVTHAAEPRRLGYILALAWAEGLHGWADDVRKARGVGLGERVRLGVHALVALGAGVGAVRLGFAGEAGFWQQVASLVVAAAAFLYVVLSTGFSDGVDGLVASLTTLSGLGYLALGVAGVAAGLAASAGAVTGAAAGALLLNAPSNWTRTSGVRRRAVAYLGDSGALVAGAAVAGLAITSQTVLLLPLLAAGVVLEGGAVFLQTGLLTPLFRRGLRQRRFRAALTLVPHTEFPLPFLATPLHHHLNLLGLRPLQTCAGFWGLQAATTVCGLAAALAVAPAGRVGFWLLGVLLLLAPLPLLAATTSLFLTGVPAPDGTEEVAICRGVPLRLWSLRLYWPVQILGGTAARCCRGAMDRSLPRFEAYCLAAALAARCGQHDLAASLLRRVPALNLLLRPEAAYLAADQARTAGGLPDLLAEWRRALRPVYQEGRLDLVLASLAQAAGERGDEDLARQLRASAGEPLGATAQPRRLR